MRLLLDEHFPRRIAAELRGRGHDVLAVTESGDLRGLADVELFEYASGEHRAVVTQGFGGFSVLLREAAVTESEHFGVIFVPRAVGSSLHDFDRLVDALARFLEERPAEDGLLEGAAWL